MIPDYHLHSEFSGDCKTPPEDMIKRAIALKMPAMCFTDHCDFDIPSTEFLIDEDVYFAKMQALQAKYRQQIDIRIGVELGLQPHLARKHHEYVNKYPFDFVIGSLHIVDDKDPYYPEVFEGKDDRVVYRAYFEQMLDNIEAFSEFQVVGHIDYVVRYGNHKAEQYSYQEYADIIDAVLQKIIDKGLGIEVNTAGFKAGLGFPHPHPDVIRRYQELGGEIITLGSDSHVPEYIGAKFEEMRTMLKDIGFKYYAQFKERKMEMKKL